MIIILTVILLISYWIKLWKDTLPETSIPTAFIWFCVKDSLLQLTRAFYIHLALTPANSSLSIFFFKIIEITWSIFTLLTFKDNKDTMNSNASFRTFKIPNSCSNALFSVFKFWRYCPTKFLNSFLWQINHFKVFLNCLVH